ncbi:hypothetical protein GW17_00057151, partial [Ensete ventricosum]
APPKKSTATHVSTDLKLRRTAQVLLFSPSSPEASSTALGLDGNLLWILSTAVFARIARRRKRDISRRMDLL